MSKDAEKGEGLAARLQAFIARVAQTAGANDIAAIKLEADQIESEWRQIREAQKTAHSNESLAGRREYDEWVAELFRLTDAATPRENLLRAFADRFAAIHAVDKDGPWIVVLEAEFPREGGAPRYRGFYQRGAHPDQWKHFCERLEKQGEEPLLAHVFKNRKRVEQWYLPYFAGSDYLGLFDALVDTKKRFRGEPNLWLSAQPLFSEWLDGHAVFLLYPNRGKLFDLTPPPGGGQDLRLLEVLAAMYRQLEFQIKNLAVYVERARRDLINQLAPGLLHHELYSLSHDLRAQAREHHTVLKQLTGEWAVPGLDVEAASALTLNKLARSIEDTTEAFLNLERRGPVADSTLDRLVFDALRLSKVRLGKVGVSVEARHDNFRKLTLRNDHTLLVHSLLNLLTNAAHAFTDGNTPPPRRIAIRLAESGEHLVLDVLNNGPAIPAEVRERIFERGYTTRPQGHGQGLYLSRLIARYAGGGLELLPEEGLPDGLTVGFRLRFVRFHDIREEIGNELIRAT
ncbi:MAG: sensor histidine kinase [Pseudomonadota bacterium]|nr:sensor histidine kinase [Pseudomonadota bacterium]